MPKPRVGCVAGFFVLFVKIKVLVKQKLLILLLFKSENNCYNEKGVSLMAKGKYEYWLTAEGLLQLGGWARNGLTDEQIAHNIGITRKTLAEWKNKYSDISDTLKINKEIVDTQVENALLKRALGYSFTETTKERKLNDTTGKYEMVTTKEVVKEVTPDTTAQIFWLKNRKPEEWRDKKDVAVEGNINSVVSSMSDEALDDRIESLKSKLGIKDE